MNITIEKIELKNFKGCKSATYEFNGKSASVLGKNGVGKTTIATAMYWTLVDCDYSLASNPPVFPLEVEECDPTVRISLNIDGKPIEVARIQHRTVKKSKTGGADSVSFSNTYEVNSVEYGLRDFKSKMEEYGFDFDLFLPLSHPDVFTSKKSDEMRKVLFSMASAKTDKEIADQVDGVEELSKLLENYTVEEVKAMQNSTLRKIKEEYGKDGEILRAKISGMEQSKTEIDVAELELAKNSLNKQIAENKAKQEDIGKFFKEQEEAHKEISALKQQLQDFQAKANEENVEKRKSLQLKISSKTDTIKSLKDVIDGNNREISRCEADIATELSERDRLAEKWKSVKNEKFDENTAICPTCHREFPEEEKERLLSEFEKTKAERLSKIEKEGTDLKNDIEDTKKVMVNLIKDNKSSEEIIGNLEEEISELKQQLSELPSEIDISDTPEYKEIKKQISEKEESLKQGDSETTVSQQLRAEYDDLQNQLIEVEKQIALSVKNSAIDEDIAGLRAKQKEYEQQKCDCEKILDQLKTVEKRKNEMLQDEVNVNFKLVKFRLFDYLKNGDVVNDCTPTIDGKSINHHSNGALRVLAKLDIISGLQRYYGQFYPVFADDFSLVTSGTENRIDMDCQLIKLKAVEDVNALKIEI